LEIFFVISRSTSGRAKRREGRSESICFTTVNTTIAAITGSPLTSEAKEKTKKKKKWVESS